MSNRASYQKIPNIRLGLKHGKTVILKQPASPAKRVFPSIPSTPVPVRPKPQGRTVLHPKF